MSEISKSKSGKKRKESKVINPTNITVSQQLEERLNASQGAKDTSLDERRFQPGAEFHVSDASCSLDVGSNEAELCLIQLPLSWDMGSEGTLRLPIASGGGLGRCTDNDGQAFHVIEECKGRSRVYAFAPGQQPHPVAIQRHFTLIKEKNLDLAEFVAENRAAVVKGAKQKQEDLANKKRKKKHDKGSAKVAEAIDSDMEVKAKKMKKKVEKQHAT